MSLTNIYPTGFYMEIENRLKQIIKGHIHEDIDVESIAEHTNIEEDFCLDSVEYVNLLVDIEKEFSVTLDDSELAEPMINEFGKLIMRIEDNLND